MPVKMIGKEFKEFYASDWGNDIYVDDPEVLVDGQDLGDCSFEDVADSSVVTILSGALFNGVTFAEAGDFVKFARAWKKRQLVSFVVCEVRKDLYDEFVKAVQEAGAKVLA